MAPAQRQRLADDDVEKRATLPCLQQRLRPLQPHRRRQPAVELDQREALERGAGVGVGVGAAKLLERGHVARRLEVAGREHRRLPTDEALICAVEAADRLLVLAGGGHLLLGGRESFIAHREAFCPQDMKA